MDKNHPFQRARKTGTQFLLEPSLSEAKREPSLEVYQTRGIICDPAAKIIRWPEIDLSLNNISSLRGTLHVNIPFRNISVFHGMN